MKNDRLYEDDARYAQLSERVTNTSTRIGALENQMTAGFTQVNNSISTLATEFRTQTKTPWPGIWAAMGVGITILAGIGTLTLWPMREGQARIQGDVDRLELATAQAITKMADATISRSEFNLTQDRGKETRDRIYADMIRTQTDLQRQIDDQKKAFGDTFSLRDAFQTLQRRIDYLEGRARQ
ncbi:hypothetical protein ACLBXM_20020 [Xanthobacteraceae bacterium A53D]